MRRVGIAAIVLAATLAAAAAHDMKSPRISHATVDWDALDAELGAIEGLAPGPAAAGNDQGTAAATRAERLGAAQSRDRRAIRRHHGQPGAGTAAVRDGRRSARSRACGQRGCRYRNRTDRQAPFGLPGGAVLLCRPWWLRRGSGGTPARDARAQDPVFKTGLHSHFGLGADLRDRSAGRHDRVAGYRRSRIGFPGDQAALPR